MDRQIELNIIKCIQEKHTEGFDKLYSEYYKYVKFICRSFVNDDALSEDLTHDVFVKTIEKINSFDVNRPGSSFKSFIRVIAYNISCNYWKRMNMEKNILKKIAEKTNEEDTSAEKPLERLKKNEREKKLRCVLDRLPQSTRILVVDYYLNGYSYLEICEAHQISKGQLGWKIKSGLKQLRRYLLNME